mgnify:CR=1 FL=1
MLEQLARERADKIHDFLERHFSLRGELQPAHARLIESVRYSLLQKGGKRFRPLLSLLVAEALGYSHEQVLAFGAAVECVHTYSLIHDDLPAMDNDDFRRGQPTNHKVFGEATAILAGDGLLTEAFQLIADGYRSEPDIAARLVAELAKAAGLYGMVGGQAIDMGSKKEAVTLDQLREMHALKTGALIRVSAVGAAIVCRAGEKQLRDIAEYSENLGLAFQVADDLLDFVPERPEPGSYPALLGVEKTRAFLNQLTEACLNSLSSWSENARPLREIALYNRNRAK